MKLYRYTSDEDSLSAEYIYDPKEIEAEHFPELKHYVTEDGTKIRESEIGRGILVNGIYSVVLTEEDGNMAANSILERALVNWIERCKGTERKAATKDGEGGAKNER